MDHEWRLVIAKGNDAPNDSLDSIYWCERCGTVRHDYAHGGGMRSPNYPIYYVPGLDAQPNSEECFGSVLDKHPMATLEAIAFRDGWLAGLTVYAKEVGHSGLKSQNETLKKLMNQELTHPRTQVDEVREYP